MPDRPADPSTATFTYGRERQTFRLARPLVRLVLKRATDCGRHWVVTFIGLPAELVEAGVADAVMLAVPVGRNQMTGTDCHGDAFQCFRRARGRVEVVRRLSDHARDPDDFGAAVGVVAAMFARCQR
jgi:hypothetical protein